MSLLQKSHFAEQISNQSKELRAQKCQHVNQPTSGLEFQANPQFMGLTSVDQNPILTSQMIAHLVQTDNEFTKNMREEKENQRIRLDQVEVSLSTQQTATQQTHKSGHKQLQEVISSTNVKQIERPIPTYLTKEKLEETKNSSIKLHQKKKVKPLNELPVSEKDKKLVQEVKQKVWGTEFKYAEELDTQMIKQQLDEKYIRELEKQMESKEWVGEKRPTFEEMKKTQIEDNKEEQEQKRRKRRQKHADIDISELQQITKQDTIKSTKAEEKPWQVNMAAYEPVKSEDSQEMKQEPQQQPEDDSDDILAGLNVEPMKVDHGTFQYMQQSATVEQLINKDEKDARDIWNSKNLSNLSKLQPSKLLTKGQNAFQKSQRESTENDDNRQSVVSGVTPYRPLGFDKGVSRESYAGSVLNVAEGGAVSTRQSMMDDFKDDHFALSDHLELNRQSQSQSNQLLDAKPKLPMVPEHQNAFQRRDTDPELIRQELIRQNQSEEFYDKTDHLEEQFAARQIKEEDKSEHEELDWASVHTADFEHSDERQNVEPSQMNEEEEEMEIDQNEEEEEFEFEVMEEVEYDEKNCFYCKFRADMEQQKKMLEHGLKVENQLQQPKYGSPFDGMEIHKICKRFIEGQGIHYLDDIMDVPVDIPELFFVHVVEDHIDWFYRFTEEEQAAQEGSKYTKLVQQLERQKQKIVGNTKPSAFKASKFNFTGVKDGNAKKIPAETGNLFQKVVKKDAGAKSFVRDQWAYSQMNSEHQSKHLHQIIKKLQDKGKM